MRAQTGVALAAVGASGLYALVSFLGSPNHTFLLLSEAQQQIVAQNCPEGSLLCRGVHSVLPAVTHAAEMAEPFLWYLVVSLVAFAAVPLVRWATHRTEPMHLSISPLHVLLAFIASTWILFTTLGLTNNASLLPEPTAQAIPDAPPATLEALQQNFRELEERGCLSAPRLSDQGVRYRPLKFSCMQASFVTRVLPQMLVALVLLVELLVLGRLLLLRLRPPPQKPLVETAYSIGIGVFGWIVLLWILGMVSALRSFLVWPLVFLIPIMAYGHLVYWLKHAFRQAMILHLERHAGLLLLGWLLVSLLALNFLHVVRPIPLGFDDLNSYLMRPRAMAALGQSIYSTATFQWEYLTSLGFVLFGHDSSFGATAAMMVNWLAGPLAVLAILAFGAAFSPSNETGTADGTLEDRQTQYRSWLGYGLLAACLYYALPLVSHFSYADMKVDNAVFFMGALATLALFSYLFGECGQEPDADPGRADNPQTQLEDQSDWKPSRNRNPRLLLLAGLFAGFAIAMKLTAVLVGIGLTVVLVLVTWFDGRHLMPWAAALGVFTAGVSTGVAPWLVHNTIRYDSPIPMPVSTAPKIHDVRFSIEGVNPGSMRPSTRTLPEELAINTSHPNCSVTDRAEELDRYWGPDRGSGRFSTLWWRTVMNLDVGGFYVTLIPAILLAPIVLLLPSFWSGRKRWARWLAVFTGALLVMWTFLGNGVPWYGIGALLGLLLALEFLVRDREQRTVSIAATLFVGLSLILALSMRFSQFAKERIMLDYALGKQSAAAYQEVLAPHYSVVGETVLERAATMPERPYLYQVGTFIPYFLADEPSHIGIADNQLGFFNCLHQERNALLTVERLQALGFNSIIFDMGTSSIEPDPKGSLHRKVAAFVEFANDRSAGVRTVINDPVAGVAFLLLP